MPIESIAVITSVLAAFVFFSAVLAFGQVTYSRPAMLGARQRDN
jgi:hypothetical protein